MAEMMKMELNIAANRDGKVGDIILNSGMLVDLDDFVLVLC